MAKIQYDFIIVGGGTSGLVLANRLTENPDVSVLVIEAGSDASADPRSLVPALFSGALQSELDWSFSSVRQQELNGRIIGHSQGKAIGGSSAINAQAVIPPSASDLDIWETIGNPGWNWEAVAPYFPKVFNLVPPEKDTSAHLYTRWSEELVNSSQGPVDISFTGTKANAFAKAWVETFDALEFPLTESPFRGKSIGAYNAASTVNAQTKTRCSSATAYVLPIKERQNLYLLADTVVERIVLENTDNQDTLPKAFGVQYKTDEECIVAEARRDIILCAGAFGSPKLLELSGIGDPNVLNPKGVTVNVENRYVGRNLQDHVLSGISFEVLDNVKTGDDLLRQDPVAIQTAMKEYQEHQSGPFATSGVTSFAYLPATNLSNSTRENISKLHVEDNTGHPLDRIRASVLQSLVTEQNEGTAQYFLYQAQEVMAGRDTARALSEGAQPGNFITVPVALSHPLSTGTSHIVSADPNQAPRIDPAYFSNVLDLELLAHHLCYVETLASTPPLANLLKPEGKRTHPAAFIHNDIEKAKEYIRLSATSNWHYVGTCAMAPRSLGGVVDSNLRVYGVSNLRIIDSSVIPLVPQSNTMTLVYAVAERAADMIKKDWNLVI